MSLLDELYNLISDGASEDVVNAADAAGSVGDVGGPVASVADLSDGVSALGDTTGALTQNTASPNADLSVPNQYQQYGEGRQAAERAAGYGAGTQAQTPGVFTKLLQGLGVANKAGDVDYSDPQVMNKILKSLQAGSSLLGIFGHKTQGYKSPAQLRAELAGPFNSWTPQQAATAGSYFGAPMAASRGLAPAPSAAMIPGRRFAGGGDIAPDDNAPTYHSPGALSRLIRGPGGGQDDLVAARLGPGEYVFDSDVVSALGDGSNTQGAKMLDKWREEIRAHKRSAPPTSIPPRAKSPDNYLARIHHGRA